MVWINTTSSMQTPTEQAKIHFIEISRFDCSLAENIGPLLLHLLCQTEKK